MRSCWTIDSIVYITCFLSKAGEGDLIGELQGGTAAIAANASYPFLLLKNLLFAVAGIDAKSCLALIRHKAAQNTVVSTP